MCSERVVCLGNRKTNPFRPSKLFVKHCYDLNHIFSCGKLSIFSETDQSQTFEAFRISGLHYDTKVGLGQVKSAFCRCSVYEKLVFRP